MIIEESKDPVETNIEGRKSFGIALNRASFTLLAKTAYRDPHRSVLIELAQNAYDAQLRNGKQEIPIRIELPTIINPILTIEDCGVGMSREFMAGDYLSVFTSTKRNNNQESGAYGIGRLVALSFAGSYTIETKYNGRKNSYSVLFNEDGIPDIIPLQESEVDINDTGTKISVCLRNEDVTRIRSAANDVFYYFPVLPTIINEGITLDIKHIKKATFDYEDEDFYVKFRLSNKPICHNGLYGYPIDGSFENLYLPFLASVIVKSELGDITPTAARDGLALDDRTNTFLKYKLAKFEAILPKLMQLYLNSINEYHELREFYNQIKSDKYRGIVNNLYFRGNVLSELDLLYLVHNDQKYNYTEYKEIINSRVKPSSKRRTYNMMVVPDKESILLLSRPEPTETINRKLANYGAPIIRGTLFKSVGQAEPNIKYLRLDMFHRNIVIVNDIQPAPRIKVSRNKTQSKAATGLVFVLGEHTDVFGPTSNLYGSRKNISELSTENLYYVTHGVFRCGDSISHKVSVENLRELLKNPYLTVVLANKSNYNKIQKIARPLSSLQETIDNELARIPDNIRMATKFKHSSPFKKTLLKMHELNKFRATKKSHQLLSDLTKAIIQDDTHKYICRAFKLSPSDKYMKRFNKYKFFFSPVIDSAAEFLTCADETDIMNIISTL